MQRCLAVPHQYHTSSVRVNGGNHPVGHVTEALLRWRYRRSLEDGQGLPEELKLTFTELCDTVIDKFRYGRVFLGRARHRVVRCGPGFDDASAVAPFLLATLGSRSSCGVGRLPHYTPLCSCSAYPLNLCNEGTEVAKIMLTVTPKHEILEISLPGAIKLGLNFSS